MHSTESKENIKRMLLETHHRFLFFEFLRLKHLFYGAEYWRLLSECYQTSNNLYTLRHQVKECFLSNEPDREQLMSAKELKRFNLLPDKLTIYRAMTLQEYESRNFGYSWTLKKKIARWYLFAYRRNSRILQLTVDKSNVLAYWNDLKQSEIFYLPH